MSEPNIPQRAKLFIAIIFSSEETLAAVEKILLKKFGEIDFRSKTMPFVQTKQSSDMMRARYMVILSYRNLIRREDIVEIKLYTNRIEKRFSEKKMRMLNIDPGYLTLSNVFRATCKDYFHRAYLRKGVYLENEYRYVARRFQPWDWTSQEYHRPEHLYFFHEMRRIYHNQIRR